MDHSKGTVAILSRRSFFFPDLAYTTKPLTSSQKFLLAVDQTVAPSALIVTATSAAERALNFSLTQYREGEVSYLEVVTSQTVALQTELESLSLDTTQLRASVQLIRALGGGWT